MAKKPGGRAEFVFFNVTYEDGSQRSNRRGFPRTPWRMGMVKLAL